MSKKPSPGIMNPDDRSRDLPTDFSKRPVGTTRETPWLYDVTIWPRHDQQGKPTAPQPPEETEREEGTIGSSWELAGTSDSGSNVIGYWKRR